MEKFNCIPDLIKIDVEGAEVLVLQGARKVLSEYMPIILLSVHSDSLREDCVSFIKGLGYQGIIPINSNDIETATELLIKA